MISKNDTVSDADLDDLDELEYNCHSLEANFTDFIRYLYNSEYALAKELFKAIRENTKNLKPSAFILKLENTVALYASLLLRTMNGGINKIMNIEN